MLGAQPEESDLENKIWTIPADRTKAGREHQEPLTDAAIAIVKGLIEPGEKYIFHNEYGRKLSNMAMLMLLCGIFGMTGQPCMVLDHPSATGRPNKPMRRSIGRAPVCVAGDDGTWRMPLRDEWETW